MAESLTQNFNHLKIHTQYSICEGAIKIDDLQEYSKSNRIKSLGLCDTSNLCGALEFAEKISKSGTQPIIGTQINFKFGETIGLLPLYALNENGYKRIIELSSLSYLKNDESSEPHLSFSELLVKDNGVALFSGTINGLFGQLFNKGKFTEIKELYLKLKSKFQDRFYIEIQRHNDQNETGFEKFNLNESLKLEIPIIATNEVFYIDKDMHEAHDALTCIGNKRKLIGYIHYIVDSVKHVLHKNKLNIVDGFSGSTVVSRELSYSADNLYTNDLELYSYLMAQCYIVIPSSEQKIRIQHHIEIMNQLAENGPYKEGIICKY